jgi:hypothetical protein
MRLGAPVCKVKLLLLSILGSEYAREFPRRTLLETVWKLAKGSRWCVFGGATGQRLSFFTPFYRLLGLQFGPIQIFQTVSLGISVISGATEGPALHNNSVNVTRCCDSKKRYLKKLSCRGISCAKPEGLLVQSLLEVGDNRLQTNDKAILRRGECVLKVL